MSLPSSDSVESIRAVLMGTSEEFRDFYDDERLVTDVLVHEALENILGPKRERLHEADKRYRLHDLLSAMLVHAPHPLGQRYVAVYLHIVHQKGEDGVVNAAKVWLDNLFLPILAISKVRKTEPVGSQTPATDITTEHIESASRKDQPLLRAKVALREQYRCAITKYFDRARSDKLGEEGRSDEIPVGPQVDMHAAHIIPSLLNNFDDKVINSPHITDAARTWDMLRSWTRIDFMTLLGPNINLPRNAIYLTTVEHRTFGQFKLYLDKEAYPDMPNKYRVRMPRPHTRLSNGLPGVDVEFPTLEESSVEPPNPAYLKVHAAFAKVLHLSGAAGYIESVERDAEMEGTLRLDGKSDFASYLRSKVAIFAS